MKYILCVLAACLSLHVSGQQFEISLLKDINSDSTDIHGQPNSFIVFKNNLIFTSTVESYSPSFMFASSGTEVGTKILFPGKLTYPRWYTIFKELLFLSAYDTVHGEELWVSDGTDSGTRMIKDINPGVGGSTPSNLKVVNNILYFIAYDTIHGQELWRSDGTEQGTFLLKDIAIGKKNSRIMGLAVYKEGLVFRARDSAGIDKLYSTDGTANGTIPFFGSTRQSLGWSGTSWNTSRNCILMALIQ